MKLVPEIVWQKLPNLAIKKYHISIFIAEQVLRVLRASHCPMFVFPKSNQIASIFKDLEHLKAAA